MHLRTLEERLAAEGFYVKYHEGSGACQEYLQGGTGQRWVGDIAIVEDAFQVERHGTTLVVRTAGAQQAPTVDQVTTPEDTLSTIRMRLQIAYTVGLRSSYDTVLAEREVTKLGKTEDYEGGWVWRSAEQAQEFLSGPEFARRFPTSSPGDFSVYRLLLPVGWDRDTSPAPAPDGVHRLLHDARIVEKVL